MKFLSTLIFGVGIAACPLSAVILPQTAATEALGYDDCNMLKNGELALLKSVLQPQSIIFDVGANIGEWSTYVLSIQPSSTIKAFEPVPETYRLLAEKFQNSRVETYNLALSDQAGTANFYFYDQSVAASQLSGFYNRDILRDVFHFQEPKMIQVSQDTLDNFCQNNKITSIDFLKIDTEGAEWKVLLGAKNLLEKQQVKALQFEYGGCYKDAKTTLHQVLQLLTADGYVVFRIIPDGLIHISHWSDSLETQQYCNYFAISESLVPAYQKIDNFGSLGNEFDMPAVTDGSH